MIYEDALSALRRHVAAAFKAGTSTFPHYTLHGEEHLQELDRLALLVGGSIPKLSKERLDLLRLAIILHDFAMVNVPDPAREEELRRQMNPDLSFADIVRKTHQDEVEHSFTRPERIALLHGFLPTAGAQILEDACTIARHHRLHPLAQAPEHVQDLCALMRILDELDIGPNRAPLPAYEALRPRMDDVSRFHWLKHLCTRPVAAYGTFSVEERNHRRILKVLVAVKATERTWRPIQGEILSKLRKCADQEGINDVLQATLGVEFELEPAPEPALSGIQLYLTPTIWQDLDSLPSSLFEIPLKPQPPPPNSAQPTPEPRPTLTVGAVPERSGREFKIVALPPETLAEALCLSGRLTVIGNRYVRPNEEQVGGVAGARSRIYVGPADCGKTRAALEWIANLTDSTVSQWVVLRTGMGTLPERMENIVLDTSHYEENRYLLPQKAILFLDDLPANLPPPSATFTATDAVQVLFRWFQELPYFRERRLVGTLRLEDTHARPEWPEVLPSLGQPLELVRLLPLDKSSYLALWEGMASGAISRSLTHGVTPFSIDLSEDFLQKVVQQPADPEAVAVFVQQNALKDRTVLEPADAERFSVSAVETWIRETWPALLGAHGLSVKIFFTLARLFEADLRPDSGFYYSVGPEWRLHEAFGPELCALAGAAAEGYLPCLRRLIEEGHASGKLGGWIRPRADFLLQADDVSVLELPLPEPLPGWFAGRCDRLSPDLRRTLALQFGMSFDLAEQLSEDGNWLGGLGIGRAMRAELANSQEDKVKFFSQATRLLRAGADREAADPFILTVLGLALGGRALQATDVEEKTTLLEEALIAYRRATDADPKSSQAWYYLAVSLGQKAERELDSKSQQALWDEEIAAYRRAAEAEPQNSLAWNQLGVHLAEKADHEPNQHSRRILRDEAIEAYRQATSADPQHSLAWNNLGFDLDQKAEDEPDLSNHDALREAAINFYRRAIDTDPQNPRAWYNLGVSLGQKANDEPDPERRNALCEEEIIAYRNVTGANPHSSRAWYNLGVSLSQKADHALSPEKRNALREEAITAYRHSIAAAPEDAETWDAISEAMLKSACESGNPQILLEAAAAAKHAVSLGAEHYNYACACAMAGDHEPAFSELRGCLDRSEISVAHVRQDPDWKHLRTSPRFQEILQATEGAAA